MKAAGLVLGAVIVGALWAAQFDRGPIVINRADEYRLDDAAVLDGGRELPISLVVIPKQLWTDSPVVTWVKVTPVTWLQGASATLMVTVARLPLSVPSWAR